jgi:hypothetical protein
LTGSRGSYIVSATNTSSGINFTLSTGNAISVSGNFRGPTLEENLTSAKNIGDDGYGFFKNISSGQLRFKGLSGGGSLSVSEGSTAVFIDTIYEGGEGSLGTVVDDTLVYLETENKISSTTIKTATDGQIGYLDFNTTSGFLNENVKVKYYGPFEINQIVGLEGELENFSQGTTNGIYLNVSKAGVHVLQTPIGIAGFTGYEPNVRYSTVIIFDGDELWKFPQTVYFESGENYLTCGKTIVGLHTNGTSSASVPPVWSAVVSARGLDLNFNSLDDQGNPLRVSDVCVSNTVYGSCCFSTGESVGTSIGKDPNNKTSIDDFSGAIPNQTRCIDYVKRSVCDNYFGTFTPGKSCQESGCFQPLGLCCSEGKCIDDTTFNECNFFGGVFWEGVTCGDYPNSDGPAYGDPAETGRFCPSNEPFPPIACCKDGVCIGDTYTRLQCELLGGIATNETPCSEANCCQYNFLKGACCREDTCLDGDAALTPKVCKDIGGVFMGENSTCSQVNCACVEFPAGDIDDTIPDGCGGSPCQGDDCPDTVGACCKNNQCSQKTIAQCASEAGQHKGIGVSCSPDPCNTTPPTGVCCYENGTSLCPELVTSNACISSGGTWNPGTCATVDCEDDDGGTGGGGCPSSSGPGTCCYSDTGDSFGTVKNCQQSDCIVDCPQTISSGGTTLTKYESKLGGTCQPGLPNSADCASADQPTGGSCCSCAGFGRKITTSSGVIEVYTECKEINGQCERYFACRNVDSASDCRDYERFSTDECDPDTYNSHCDDALSNDVSRCKNLQCTSFECQLGSCGSGCGPTEIHQDRDECSEYCSNTPPENLDCSYDQTQPSCIFPWYKSPGLYSYSVKPTSGVMYNSGFWIPPEVGQYDEFFERPGDGKCIGNAGKRSLSTFSTCSAGGNPGQTTISGMPAGIEGIDFEFNTQRPCLNVDILTEGTAWMMSLYGNLTGLVFHYGESSKGINARRWKDKLNDSWPIGPGPYDLFAKEFTYDDFIVFLNNYTPTGRPKGYFADLETWPDAIDKDLPALALQLRMMSKSAGPGDAAWKDGAYIGGNNMYTTGFDWPEDWEDYYDGLFGAAKIQEPGGEPIQPCDRLGTCCNYAGSAECYITTRSDCIKSYQILQNDNAVRFRKPYIPGTDTVWRGSNYVAAPNDTYPTDPHFKDCGSALFSTTWDDFEMGENGDISGFAELSVQPIINSGDLNRLNTLKTFLQKEASINPCNKCAVEQKYPARSWAFGNIWELNTFDKLENQGYLEAYGEIPPDTLPYTNLAGAKGQGIDINILQGTTAGNLPQIGCFGELPNVPNSYDDTVSSGGFCCWCEDSPCTSPYLNQFSLDPGFAPYSGEDLIYGGLTGANLNKVHPVGYSYLYPTPCTSCNIGGDTITNRESVLDQTESSNIQRAVLSAFKKYGCTVGVTGSFIREKFTDAASCGGGACNTTTYFKNSSYNFMGTTYEYQSSTLALNSNALQTVACADNDRASTSTGTVTKCKTVGINFGPGYGFVLDSNGNNISNINELGNRSHATLVPVVGPQLAYDPFDHRNYWDYFYSLPYPLSTFVGTPAEYFVKGNYRSGYSLRNYGPESDTPTIKPPEGNISAINNPFVGDIEPTPGQQPIDTKISTTQQRGNSLIRCFCAPSSSGLCKSAEQRGFPKPANGQSNDYWIWIAEDNKHYYIGRGPSTCTNCAGGKQVHPSHPLQPSTTINNVPVGKIYHNISRIGQTIQPQFFTASEINNRPSEEGYMWPIIGSSSITDQITTQSADPGIYEPNINANFRGTTPYARQYAWDNCLHWLSGSEYGKNEFKWSGRKNYTWTTREIANLRANSMLSNDVNGYYGMSHATEDIFGNSISAWDRQSPLDFSYVYGKILDSTISQVGDFEFKGNGLFKYAGVRFDISTSDQGQSTLEFTNIPSNQDIDNSSYFTKSIDIGAPADIYPLGYNGSFNTVRFGYPCSRSSQTFERAKSSASNKDWVGYCQRFSIVNLASANSCGPAFGTTSCLADTTLPDGTPVSFNGNCGAAAFCFNGCGCGTNTTFIF